MHRNIRRATVSALAAALLSTSAGAEAQRPTDSRQRLLAEAHEAVDEGRLAEARDLWMAVWRLERSQVAACNIGALSYRIGVMPDAVRWLSLCKEIMRPPETPEERTLHESRLVDLARARQLVGEIRVIAPRGAQVTIDGAPVEAARDEAVPVEPGRHIVRATLDDATAEVVVDVPRGETRFAHLAFPPPAERPPALRPSPPPRAPSRPSPAVITAGIGVSAGFAVLGSVLRVAAQRRAEAVFAYAEAAGESGCFRLTSPECQKAAAARDDMRSLRVLSTVSLIAGGAVLAATLGYRFYPRGQADVRVSAEGITVRGVF